MRFLLPGKIYFLTLLFLSYLHVVLGESGSAGEEPRQAKNGVSQSVPPESSTKASSTVSAAALGKSSLEQGQVVNDVNQSVPYESSTKTSCTTSGVDSSKTPQPILVIQTPAVVKVMEGSTLCMECSILQNNLKVWYIQWFKNGTEIALTNSSRISIVAREKERFSHLILRETEITDSGIYRCILRDHADNCFPSNGTQLTVDGITDLMVNQTPEHINQPEGTNVTIECRFRTVSDYSSTNVRWYRNKTKLTSAGDSLRIELDLERGFASLTLTNAAASDSGNYICRVESRSRNLTGSGKASSVAITTANQNTEPKTPPGTSLATIGAGVGAGVAILLLVVAGVILLKHRSKVSRSELETSPAKEIGLHPALVSQPSEVTYADLHFNKREVRPDAEVVYAEVRAPQKRQAGQGAKQMGPAGNQSR